MPEPIIVDNLEANIARLIKAEKAFFGKIIKQIRDTKPTIIREDQKIIEFLKNFKIDPTDLSKIETLLKATNEALSKIKLEIPESFSLKESKALIDALKDVKKAVKAQDLTVNIDTTKIEKLLTGILDNLPQISFPDEYPLPANQVKKIIEAIYRGDLATKEGQEDIVDAIKNIKVRGGGGGGVSVVGLKSSTDVLISPATEEKQDDLIAETDPTTKYNLSDFDVSSDPIYIGKIDKDGNWFIKKITIATGIVLYAIGTTGYTAAWSDRTLQSYDVFNNKF